MKIIIGADICITKEEEILNAKFVSGDAEGIVGKEILDRLNKADFRMFNIEAALTTGGKPITKCGPCLRMDPRGMSTIKKFGIDLAAIGNNHTYDFGAEGFVDTLNTLKENGVPYVGGGETKEEVKKPFIFEKEGKKIGVYCCCEHEFSWFSDYGIGTNGFDPLETPDEIAELKKSVDFLIVLYHGGRECYRYPFPYMQKVCRKIAEKGADLVVCQHTHCIGSEEDYKGSKIIYGTGNFVFCKYIDYDEGIFEQTAMLLEVTIEGDKVSYDYIPFTVDHVGIYPTDDPTIIGDYFKRSEELKQEGFVEKHFAEYADAVGDYYAKRIMNDGLAVMMNYTNCEPHREMLGHYLKKTVIKGDMK